MVDPFILEIILEVVKAIIGVAIPALTVYLAFYAKRINENVKLKALQNKVDNLTAHSLQVKSLEIVDYETRVAAVVDSAEAYAARNDMNFSRIEIQMMVESSFNSLRVLENTGLRLYKQKLQLRKKE